MHKGSCSHDTVEYALMCLIVACWLCVHLFLCTVCKLQHKCKLLKKGRSDNDRLVMIDMTRTCIQSATDAKAVHTKAQV
jgi:hypothetical protein